MSTENDQETPPEDTKAPAEDQPESKSNPEKTEEERIEALIEARLKPMKENLDRAYAARDAEKQRADTLASEKREQEIKRLEAEGKVAEAANARVADAEARLAELEKRNTELTRDLSLKDSLKSLDFRNDRAFDMAYQEIVANLVRDEKGGWMHKSGSSVQEAVKKFGEDDTNNFLFKPKSNNGGGTVSNPTPPAANTKKSVFQMTQAEVLALAASGKT